VGIGVREILWLAIALLAVYVAVQLYRALRLGADHGPVGSRRDEPAARTTDSGRDDDDGGVVYDRPRPSSAPAAAAPVRTDGFQIELEVQQLRRDIGQLRTELDVQRKEVAELAARLSAQQEQVDANLATKGASPEYNEALVFARRGLDVEAIAERCGITVAEAALVRALAQGEQGSPGQRP